jgi:hypothetical protein
MTEAGAAAPSMFAVFRKRDFSLRLAGLDQRDLRDLRRSRPQALPKTYAEAGWTADPS